MGNDYKSTVFLPATAFPMKARLPEREPEILESWSQSGLEEKLRNANKGCEKFILHDGPPYANGHLHIGHALNKILKDIINRSQRMLGREVAYVPGWDCHGLPIEWKIEEKYRADGRDKDEVPILEFRRECREFADHWITVQSKEFKRLGVDGDWNNPYTTMNFAAEAAIVRELGKFLMNGGLYRGEKPVMWSVVEKTALAEAEVEYADHSSTQVWVRFPVVMASQPRMKNASVVIWTTTPWTLPGNRAVAYGKDIDYVLVEVAGIGEDSLARPDERLVVAEALLEEIKAGAVIDEVVVCERFKGPDLAGTICRHPFHDQGYDFEVPLVEGFHVTTEAGTGFVHIAPGHGAEDFEVGQGVGLEVPHTVGGDGLFYNHVPLFAGTHVFKADAPVVEALKECDALLATGKITHSYPHSWRSKAPLIFRTTPQWFISMETGGLREKALAAIESTRWVPPAGHNRIHAMVESRPDWCVSRQRAWGVPITVFFHKETGEPLRDEKVLERIVEAVAEEGADAWFSSDSARFLGDDHAPEEYQQVTDILDVWFDSGSTHAFVLEARDNLTSPASLYLEGSDQHRGWFQSSLLESCGTRERAPYEAVLTHGFVLDEKGHKMSKSAGNVVAPQEIIDTLGADILRLWVATSDYTVDLRIGPEILKAQADSYRRLRNTLRYVLGNLAGFSEDERMTREDMPELERWVLHRLWALDRRMHEVLDGFNFHTFFAEIYTFCAVDLSAFYFDIRKDALYCDQVDAPRRRAARTVLDILFRHLTAWLAPVLCFTAEEAWRSRTEEGDVAGTAPESGEGSEAESVHLRSYPQIPADWRDDELAVKWETVRDLRRVVTGAIEIARAEKQLGSSLQAHPVVYADETYRDSVDGLDVEEIVITSGFDLSPYDSADSSSDRLFTLEDVPGVAVQVILAEGGKCQRCWKVLPEVSCDDEGGLCLRCMDAVSNGC